MTVRDRETKSMLTQFALPFAATFLLVNALQLSPILASWTTVSVLGIEGARYVWLLLVFAYSLVLALSRTPSCWHFRVLPRAGTSRRRVLVFPFAPPADRIVNAGR